MTVPTARTIDRLVFVYAADSGLLSAAIDSARKVLRLRGCALCSITHGLTGEKREWAECRDEIGVPVDYVHLDELTADLRRTLAGAVPAVVAETAGERVVLVGPEVLERCKGSVADLKGRLQTHAAMNDLAFPAVGYEPR